jgi:hypothetical protein
LAARTDEKNPRFAGMNPSLVGFGVNMVFAALPKIYATHRVGVGRRLTEFVTQIRFVAKLWIAKAFCDSGSKPTIHST